MLETEYPNGIRLTLLEPIDEPIRPRSLHPAFYGCYDWHSAVHSHWQLVRAMRTLPTGGFADEAMALLDRTLTPDNIEAEMWWISERPSFEMPYGMAWVFALCGELQAWDTPSARGWKAALEPLGHHARERFAAYCERAVRPIRGGMHNQTAFSLGLVWDAAARLGDQELGELVERTALHLYLNDRNAELAYEPSAADFLSPTIAEAELLGRVLNPEPFAAWLSAFAPNGFGRLTPVQVVDPSDGQLAHWAGLNLSRCWMLRRIADSLPHGDDRIAGLLHQAANHAEQGLPMASHPDYMVSHWVPTFAMVLLSN